MTTYKIVRFHQDLDVPNEVIVRGLTLEQAEAHCQREDTHGETWFDGYTEEDPSAETLAKRAEQDERLRDAAHEIDRLIGGEA